MPKEFEKALKQRTMYGEKLLNAIYEVDTFIHQFGLDDSLDEANYGTGCEVLVNPSAAEQAVRRAFNEIYF